MQANFTATHDAKSNKLFGDQSFTVQHYKDRKARCKISEEVPRKRVGDCDAVGFSKPRSESYREPVVHIGQTIVWSQAIT